MPFYPPIHPANDDRGPAQTTRALAQQKAVCMRLSQITFRRVCLMPLFLMRISSHREGYDAACNTAAAESSLLHAESIRRPVLEESPEHRVRTIRQPGRPASETREAAAGWRKSGLSLPVCRSATSCQTSTRSSTALWIRMLGSADCRTSIRAAVAVQQRAARLSAAPPSAAPPSAAPLAPGGAMPHSSATAPGTTGISRRRVPRLMGLCLPPQPAIMAALRARRSAASFGLRQATLWARLGACRRRCRSRLPGGGSRRNQRGQRLRLPCQSFIEAPNFGKPVSKTKFTARQCGPLCSHGL